jgi:hypothetical protein
MRSVETGLILYDCYMYLERRFGCRHTGKTVKTQGDGSYLEAQERASEENNSANTLISVPSASRIGRK